ncbi:MAG: hypothetical protein QW648_00655, partial [Nanoarchaeales archaeon]
KLDKEGTWRIIISAKDAYKEFRVEVKKPEQPDISTSCKLECEPIPSQATVGQTISIRCKCTNCNERFFGYYKKPTGEEVNLKCYSIGVPGGPITIQEHCVCDRSGTFAISDSIKLDKEGTWRIIISAKDAYKEFRVEVKKCQLTLLSLSPTITNIPSDLCGKTINIRMYVTYTFSGDCIGEKIIVKRPDGSTFCEILIGTSTVGRCSGDYNVPLSSGTYVFTATYKGLSSVSNSINVRCSTPSPTPGEGGSPGDRHKFLAPFPISINLKKGWNLISNPTDLEISVEDLKNFGCSIKGKLIYYDSETKKWVRTDKMLPNDKGYWIYLNNECSITLVPSEKLKERNIVLSKGWNLVNGLDGITCKDLEKYGCKVRMRNNNCFISYVNNAWRYLNKTEIGKGYWIYCE